MYRSAQSVLQKLDYKYKPYLTFAHDFLMAMLTIPLALLLRVGDEIGTYSSKLIFTHSVIYSLIATSVFLVLRTYSGVWRYVSSHDLLRLVAASASISLLHLPLMLLMSTSQVLPRSIIGIAFLVLTGLLCGPRFIYRIFEDLNPQQTPEVTSAHNYHSVITKPILLYGVNNTVESFIRYVKRLPSAPYDVVGIIDDTRERVGRHIHGIEVVGILQDLPHLMDKFKIRPQMLVLTSPYVEGAFVRGLLGYVEKLQLTLAKLPKLTEFDNPQTVTAKPVAIEDLLGRTPTQLDRGSMQALIQGKRVLITGAGGTIGGELARQIAAFNPAHLSLCDHAEFALYQIDLEIEESFPSLPHSSYLVDVKDQARVHEVFAYENPELVFHAAALKHVPLAEANPLETVATNVLGTRNVAEACRHRGVGVMVLISTDKAINPSSLMGATKRLAESYCQALDLASVKDQNFVTRYVTVRFGNVLGSTGSVVPLFQRQITRGGPVTVTDPHMTRYFMTSYEAVELVLQAAALTGVNRIMHGGEIFVLDMGEPVKIVDLAYQMIHLAGLKPGIDIEVHFTGLRPGEKLREELFDDREQMVPTPCKGIMMATPRVVIYEQLAQSLNHLEHLIKVRDGEGMLKLFCSLVPEYHPQGLELEYESSAPSA